MKLGFQKAKREQIFVKCLLAGPSGSGKSYSALRLASGMAKEANSRVAAIDTENGRIRYYASEFDFDDMQLDAPFTPEKYVSAIQEAVDAGYKVLIIDSISHEWEYCLTTHNNMPGNSYTNWRSITPRHDAFMEKILQAPIHVVATARGKDEYVLEEKNGKQTPKKVGLGYKQRDGVEYDYTLTFNIAQDTHIAESTKDNTHLFEGRYEVLTEKDGVALYNWANSGEIPAPKPKKVETTVPDDGEDDPLKNKIDAILNLAKEKIAAGVDKDSVYKVISDNNNGKKNPNSVKDIEVANKIYDEIYKMEA